jgi:hypothetical protein
MGFKLQTFKNLRARENNASAKFENFRASEYFNSKLALEINSNLTLNGCLTRFEIQFEFELTYVQCLRLCCKYDKLWFETVSTGSLNETVSSGPTRPTTNTRRRTG